MPKRPHAHSVIPSRRRLATAFWDGSFEGARGASHTRRHTRPAPRPDPAPPFARRLLSYSAPQCNPPFLHTTDVPGVGLPLHETLAPPPQHRPGSHTAGREREVQEDDGAGDWRNPTPPSHPGWGVPGQDWKGAFLRLVAMSTRASMATLTTTRTSCVPTATSCRAGCRATGDHPRYHTHTDPPRGFLSRGQLARN